ncbi:MAG TPA: hypothetical protein VGF24_13570 [Vicinamibacterales bacterium]
MKHHLTPIIVLLSVCAATPAAAQTQSLRPYKALFGGATNDPSVKQSLDVTISVAEGYDDDVLADNGATGVGAAVGPPLSGVYTDFSPALTYVWGSDGVQLSAMSSASVRYYQPEHEFLGTTYFGSFGLSMGSRRTHFSVDQSVNYSPAYFYGLFPQFDSTEVAGTVTTVGPGRDYAVHNDPALIYYTSAALTRDLTQRSSISVAGTYSYTDLATGVIDRQDLRSYSVGGRYLYSISRYSTLHLGYTYREGQYSYEVRPQSVEAHDIDIGVDYHRPLSFSRRTHIDFSVGSSLVTTPTFDSNTEQGLQYRLVAGAGLSHDMGRTWRARVAYDRSLGFVPGIRDPLFSDSVNTSLDGFLNRRVDLHVAGGLSFGKSAVVSLEQNDFRTYTGSARLRSAITKSWALFAEYVYYSYNLGQAILTTTAGVPQALDRNTVRVGLTTWLPLMRK